MVLSGFEMPVEYLNGVGMQAFGYVGLEYKEGVELEVIIWASSALRS